MTRFPVGVEGADGIADEQNQRWNDDEMRHLVREALESPDHVLDPLRNRVAELRIEGHAEGFISTRVETRWSQCTGRLWWTTWTHPSEVLVFEISWVADGQAYLSDDGVEDSSSQTVLEILNGVVTLYGDQYELRWLTGDELTAAEQFLGISDLLASSNGFAGN